MREKLYKLIEKYDSGEEGYREYFYDENKNEYYMPDEVQELFESYGVVYKLDISDCYESCGYACDMLSIAWIENDELFMENILLESY